MTHQTTLATLDTDTAPAPKERKPVELRTARDYLLNVQALEERVDNLKKLGKKNDEEGYKREAKTILADAQAIEHFILPRFREQVEMPLKTTKQVRASITEALRPLVRDKLVVKTNEERLQISVSTRETELVHAITNRVIAFADSLFEEAYNAGYSAREHSFEEFAMRAMDAMFAADGA
jgi:hypothetical protein